MVHGMFSTAPQQTKGSFGPTGALAHTSCDLDGGKPRSDSTGAYDDHRAHPLPQEEVLVVRAT
jgi:hypothetical protein